MPSVSNTSSSGSSSSSPINYTYRRFPCQNLETQRLASLAHFQTVHNIISNLVEHIQLHNSVNNTNKQKFLEKTLKKLQMIVKQRPKLSMEERNELDKQLRNFVEQQKAMHGIQHQINN